MSIIILNVYDEEPRYQFFNPGNSVNDEDIDPQFHRFSGSEPTRVESFAEGPFARLTKKSGIQEFTVREIEGEAVMGAG